MSSVAETCMQTTLARLNGSPAMSVTVRRGHRTPPTREMGTVVDLVDGQDAPLDDSECARKREKEFSVVITGRDDSGVTGLDALVVEVNARLNPSTPYANGVWLKQGAIVYDEEVADLDLARIEMRFKFEYTTNGWRLDA